MSIIIIGLGVQVAEAISLPSSAVLAGLLMIVSFSMSHSVVEVSDSNWY